MYRWGSDGGSALLSLMNTDAMCSGVKMRVRTNSSHGIPLTAAMTWPDLP